METIRLWEGFNERQNIRYYRDYELRERDFLQDENLSEVKELYPNWDNDTAKFDYDYYKAVYYDTELDESDNIYFCIKKERYIVYTDKNIYEFGRDDTILLYDTDGKDFIEVFAKGLQVGEYINMELFDGELEEVTEIDIVE